MDIEFCSRSLEKACNSEKELIRRWGKDRGRTIGRRLQQLAAAERLKVMAAIPPAKFHPLKGKRAGRFGSRRGLPVSTNFGTEPDPIPTLKDGGIDLSKVTKIRIIEVVDYHGD